jgi:type I restriction enzyme S subunit
MSEWPDFEIPDTWTLTRIEELAETLRAGGTPSRKKKSYFGGDIPFAIIEDITASDTYLESTKQTITKEGLEASSAWIVPEGSVLLSMYATIGATAINTLPLATNQAILAIIPKSTCHPEFLCYCLRAHKRNLAQLNVESTQKNVNKGIVSAFRLPLPPLQEQKSIAYILSAVQRAIETQERIIQTTTELKKALMQKLFSEGLRGEPQKETEIGLVPESWETPTIESVCTIRASAMTYAQLEKSPSVENGVRVQGVKVSDMNLPGNEIEFGSANLERLLSEKEACKRTIPANSIIFPKRGAAIATNKKRLTKNYTVLDPNLIAVIPSKTVNHRYLFQWFNTFDLKKITDPGPTPQLNKKDIAPLRFPMPPLDEQQEIAAAIDATEEKNTLYFHKRAQLENLYNALLNELMTGQTRVREHDLLSRDAAQ